MKAASRNLLISALMAGFCCLIVREDALYFFLLFIASFGTMSVIDTVDYRNKLNVLFAVAGIVMTIFGNLTLGFNIGSTFAGKACPQEYLPNGKQYKITQKMQVKDKNFALLSDPDGEPLLVKLDKALPEGADTLTLSKDGKLDITEKVTHDR